MRPTRVRLLAAVAIAAAALGWVAADLFDSRLGRYFPVPWTAPATFALLGIALLLWTRGIRARLAGKPDTKPVPPLVAARTAALAMAASRVGAFFVGWYAGVLIQLLPSRQVELVRGYSLAAAAAVLGALLVVVAALWLEHSCRLPDPPPDPLGERGSTPAPQ
jgi:Protein of unknown function (DUF3180)